VTTNLSASCIVTNVLTSHVASLACIFITQHHTFDIVLSTEQNFPTKNCLFSPQKRKNYSQNFALVNSLTEIPFLFHPPKNFLANNFLLVSVENVESLPLEKKKLLKDFLFPLVN
jgi:hypothetical protein